MTINFVGNIGKDAELRTVKVNGEDTKVCSFWVAENISKRDGSSRAVWHKVTIWRGYAEKMAQYLKKGRHILVEGYGEAKTYTTADNRIVPYIDVQPGISGRIMLLDKKSEDDVPPETAVSAEPTEEETPWG